MANKKKIKLTKVQKEIIGLIDSAGVDGMLIQRGMTPERLSKMRNDYPDFNQAYLDAVGITEYQERFLTIFQSQAANISTTCKALGMSRNTYHQWYRDNPYFQQRAEEIKEGLLDFTESMLMKSIQDGNMTGIIFHLKTRGRNRGYVEEQRQVVTATNVNINSDMTSEELDQKIADLEEKLKD